MYTEPRGFYPLNPIAFPPERKPQKTPWHPTQNKTPPHNSPKNPITEKGGRDWEIFWTQASGAHHETQALGTGVPNLKEIRCILSHRELCPIITVIIILFTIYHDW